MTEGYVTANRVDHVAKELDSLRPAAIIDASSWGGALVTATLHDSGTFAMDEGRYVDELEPIRKLVRTNYVFARDVAEWPAYTLSTANSVQCIKKPASSPYSRVIVALGLSRSLA